MEFKNITVSAKSASEASEKLESLVGEWIDKGYKPQGSTHITSREKTANPQVVMTQSLVKEV